MGNVLEYLPIRSMCRRSIQVANEVNVCMVAIGIEPFASVVNWIADAHDHLQELPRIGN